MATLQMHVGEDTDRLLASKEASVARQGFGPQKALPLRALAAATAAGVFGAAAVAIARAGPSSGIRGATGARPANVFSLVELTCAPAGGQCSASKGCCDTSNKCFEKNEYWSSCKATCDPNTPDTFDGKKWSCKEVGGGDAASGEVSLPLCADPLDKACLDAKCSIADGGAAGDCLKTWCCKMPGTQCYQQNAYWAGCKPACDPNADTEMGGKGWSCKELGPRTPGDNHAWKPCPKEDVDYPLLVDGDAKAAWDSAEKRAKDLVKTLQLDDKVALLNGQDDPWPNDRHGYAGYINPNFFFRNKCAMPLMLNDGPQGYNHYQERLSGTTTQFPALLTVAASFDPEAARRYSSAISDEFVKKGANVMLGPDVEVGRNGMSGRAFETLSGEDPYLGSQLVKPFVQETLKRGIIVTVKHWLDNNEEDYRQTMNVNVSERAQHEIYMPVFRAAIEAGAGAVMCSYQKVGGVHACENEHILKKLLRDDLGFKGFVMSDWGATHDAVRSARNGLDMEMPGGASSHFAKLAQLVKDGQLDEAIIDAMATHVLSSMYAAGLFDGQFPWATGEAALDTNVTSHEHREVAKRAILDGAVLLKNEGNVLPLKSPAKIAMVGPYCNHAHDKGYGQGDVFSGGGSGYVMSHLQVTPLEGITEHFSSTQVTWSETAEDAAEADVSIVCASAHAEEGWDRPNFTVPEAAMLTAALKAKSPLRKVVVLAITPGVITSHWVQQADAALVLFMPGEQVGRAVAELLSGAANPAGRLPVSFPHRVEHRFEPSQYPGVPFNDVNMTAQWSEGVLVGYRWNDAKGIASAFPFGFGLSYTAFTYSAFSATCDAKAETAVVKLTVTNTGMSAGADVPQLYIGFPSLAPAKRQLRGFKKVYLKAGETTSVSFSLSSADWSTWDEHKQAWASALARGEQVKVYVGKSSTDFAWNSDLLCA